MQRDAEQAAVKEQQVQARQEEEAAVVHDEKPQLSKNEQMRLKQAIEEIEAQITAKEAQLETVSTELQAASEAQLFDKIQSKSIEYSTLENELESLVAEWEKLVSE